jgi:hypothetical protein
MNMQTIQVMILLLDAFIALAPWRTVTEMMDRIGCDVSESLARGLVIAAACAGICALSTASIFASLPLIGYFGSAVQTSAAVQLYPVRILSRFNGTEAALQITNIIAAAGPVCWIAGEKRGGTFHA